MRPVVYAFFICLAASCGHSLNPNVYEVYKGNPYKVETYTYNIIRDNSTPDTLLTDITVDYYDSEGHKLLMESYDSLWNKSFGDFEIKYDRKGNVTMWINREFDGYPELTNQFEYIRHGLVSKKITSNGLFTTTMEGKLDAKKRIMQLDYRDKDGTLKDREEVTYDKEWRKIKYLNYDKQDFISSRKDYRYDTQGNQVEIRNYGGATYLKSIDKQYFNSHNDLIRKETFVVEKSDSIPFSVQRNSYTYDRHGNWTEREYFVDNVLIIIYKKVFNYPESN